jgi:pimeloyl-ACP methyl ester carboxylesterase
MATPPETLYAKSGDVSIAYQVVGSGSFDLVVVPGFLSHLDLLWESPFYAAWVNRLASFARVILFDKRGTGLSDRDVGESTLEERMDDLRAVLDAACSNRAAVLAVSEGGALAILFTATYPERVRALVLASSWARQASAPDYPEANGGASIDEWRRIIDTAWGEGRTLKYFAPSLLDVPRHRRFQGRFERAVVSPSAARIHLSWIFDVDVRLVARALQVPTLVLHREGDQTVPVAIGRWLGRNIPNARYFEQPGDHHIPWLGDAEGLLDQVQHFLTGSHEKGDSDRVLATVVFTDIVGSTELVARFGDRVWKEFLDRHHALVRDQLAFSGGLTGGWRPRIRFECVEGRPLTPTVLGIGGWPR